MHKSNGFTLVELMVVVAIAAILSAIAAPSLKRLIQSTTISSNVNTFLADMRYARSESIRRGGGVVMCRSDDPEAASPTCGSGSGPNGNGWVSGWIIFHDLDNNGQKAAAETLLRVQSPITSINTIVEDSKGSSSTKFQFTATGRTYNLNSATTLTFGSPDLFKSDVQRTVCVSLNGRTRIAGDGSTAC
ncbi:MAG: prepilin-type N-terminal cleavage/methylation domain-containing protein [Glaciimonas sp.]|nr:prepilin-type N-terminal cleavage/methylation domain-containing protein [Glaciimonas sp.]